MSANPDGVLYTTMSAAFDAGVAPVEAMLGPFNIPDGAVIKEFKMIVLNGGSEPMKYRLWEYDPLSFTFTLLAEISSSASGSLSTLVAGSPVVDNANKSYQVEVVHADGSTLGTPIPGEGFEVNLATLAYEFSSGPPPPAP